MGERRSIERLAGLLDRQANQLDAASYTYTHLEKAGAYDAYKRHVRRVRDLDGAIERAAQSLGASACVDSPVRTRYL